jgi:hypothetical protein
MNMNLCVCERERDDKTSNVHLQEILCNMSTMLNVNKEDKKVN